MKNFTAVQLAYLAGIIDGEGSIYIGNFSRNKKTGAKYYQTAIEVTNTEEGLIDWLLENIGGRSYKYTKNQLPKNSNREVYRWIVNGDLLTNLCHLLLPYLIIKKNQCNIMIKMRKTFELTGNNRGKRNGNSLPQEVIDERQSYLEEMQKLHCRNYKNKL